MGVEEALDGGDKETIIKERFNEAVIDDDGASTAERVKGLIEDSKKLLVPDLESVVGAWGLIDSDPVTGKIALFYFTSVRNFIIVKKGRLLSFKIIKFLL
jgi:hypothetical protein